MSRHVNVIQRKRRLKDVGINSNRHRNRREEAERRQNTSSIRRIHEGDQNHNNVIAGVRRARPNWSVLRRARVTWRSTGVLRNVAS